MAYAWDGHHLMNALAKGEKTLAAYEAYITKISKDYEADDILMNFVTNHDENSWNGTIKVRMGDASKLMTALSFTLKGMPLIYSGQKYDLDYRSKFFEKDLFPKTKGESWKFLIKLGQLKNSNLVLNDGKNAASYKQLDAEKDILLFERSKESETILFVGNF